MNLKIKYTLNYLHYLKVIFFNQKNNILINMSKILKIKIEQSQACAIFN